MDVGGGTAMAGTGVSVVPLFVFDRDLQRVKRRLASLRENIRLPPGLSNPPG